MSAPLAIRDAVQRIVEGANLSASESHAVMHEIMSGEAPEP